MSKYGWSNNNLIVKEVQFNKLALEKGSIVGSTGTAANGLVFKNLYNDTASSLTGTALNVEIDLNGTPYYFAVYPTKA